MIRELGKPKESVTHPPGRNMQFTDGLPQPLILAGPSLIVGGLNHIGAPTSYMYGYLFV